MAADGSICCTTSVAIGQRAFSNYNGIGIHVCYSPQAPSPAAAAAWRHPASQLQPPPMLAVILDATMAQECLHAAQQALVHALSQLNPQTRLLLLLADQAVSIVDLKTPKPQCWVLHGLGAQQQGSASILPQIVRVADIRATPLAHCEPFLGATLSALRHHSQQQSMQHHLRTTAAAVDIALFLLTASMAAWDAQHRQQQLGLDQQMLQLAPMHNARVMLLTGLPSSSTRSASTAAALLQQFEQQQAQQLQQMFRAVGNKACSLDIPLDVITGSLAAPSAQVQH
ncbi:hypothetical protein COO60DRAFT_1180616 [Scenedesmus sp. NREL 46B-D3]|nr:hypothetical protein COO60DRAFT_1180616 [Scenedesmus sp. NREL 46B-D3]